MLTQALPNPARKTDLVSLRRKLPPLTAMTAFEASARLASFTNAAEELGVSQAAVSRQIHLLEEILGFPLFRRLHRKIELTEKGRSLSAATTSAFGQLADAVTDLCKGDSGDELTISASIALSQFWLLPKITSFTQSHPEVKLRIVTQDNSPSLETGDVDLAIRFGNGMWPDGHAELLFHDEIFPVCSAAYAREIGTIAGPEGLTRYPLITSNSYDPTWIGWKEWLAAFSVEAPPNPKGIRCSFYTEAIHAALSGPGIALGWRHLIDDFLKQERLVRLIDNQIRTRDAYFIVVPRRRKQKDCVELFKNWVQKFCLE
jgi:DNA-binding transcriptional LysR family regulator